MRGPKMLIDTDLHLHGYYSGAVSDRMKIPTMAEQSAVKGLDLVGTGDILHPGWREHVKNETERCAPGIFENSDCRFMLTTEVEDKNRVHHILLFPCFESVEKVYSDFKEFSPDIDKDGRPRLNIGGGRIAGVAKDHNCLVGPAHAFTPWTAVYGHHDSLEDCYGNMASELDFLELGLSADSELADLISDHNDLVFLSNSDAHSPWPHKMGREFNRFKLEELSFPEFKKALHRKGGRETVLNVGFDPREGKYHCTACQNCNQKYALEQAEQSGWKCRECGKSIKKGVKDRIGELSDGGNTPDWRPNYTHLVPLAEIIREVVGHASVKTKTVQNLYDKFISKFDSEIAILVDRPIEALEEVNKKVADAVQKFRKGKTVMIPGGGGEYGELVIPRDEEERQRILKERKDEIKCRYDKSQKQLSDF
ncbi:MAG: TIGR00375 family protein [Candidatus Nanohaloarchaea archaeon]|nr:TIGR00375 family protein [Candidatus Nanohaloarchaea archaeon]